MDFMLPLSGSQEIDVHSLDATKQHFIRTDNNLIKGYRNVGVPILVLPDNVAARLDYQGYVIHMPGSARLKDRESRAFLFSHIRLLRRKLIRWPHKARGGVDMGRVKRLTLDRYELGLLVRALYEEWHRMQAEGKPTEDMEDLTLKVIDAPAKKRFGRFIFITEDTIKLDLPF